MTSSATTSSTASPLSAPFPHSTKVVPCPPLATLPRTYRWGLLGAGAISTDFAHALHSSVPSAAITFVASRPESAAAAKQLASLYGSPSGCHTGSYSDCCSSPLVDIVYIGTVHTQHYSHARLAIDAGKHILLEKPFTVTTAQAEQLVAAAHTRRVFLMEAMWVRFMPWMLHLRRLLDDGQLGEVRQLIADFSCRFPSSIARAFDPAVGGGSLLDIGIYPLSLASFLFPAYPSSIQAIASFLPSGVDDSVSVQLSYNDGRQQAQLFSSVTVNGPRQVHIVGDKGRVLVHDDTIGAGRHWYGSTRMTVVRQSADDDGTEVEERYEFPLLPAGETHDGWKGEHRVLLAYEAQVVMECIGRGELECAVMPHDETLRVMRMMDAVRQQIGLVYPDDRFPTGGIRGEDGGGTASAVDVV